MAKKNNFIGLFPFSKTADASNALKKYTKRFLCSGSTKNLWLLPLPKDGFIYTGVPDGVDARLGKIDSIPRLVSYNGKFLHKEVKWLSECYL